MWIYQKQLTAGGFAHINLLRHQETNEERAQIMLHDEKEFREVAHI